MMEEGDRAYCVRLEKGHEVIGKGILREYFHPMLYAYTTLLKWMPLIDNG